MPKEKLDDNSSFGYYDNHIKKFTELFRKKENNNGISQQTPDKPKGFLGELKKLFICGVNTTKGRGR